MADENKPAFYPRVGRNIAKNFRSAQPPAFIEDPRAMELPQFGDVDLSVPSRENLEMARRMAERDAQLKRQQQADRSPLEKLAGGVQAGRFMGSALTQAVNSLPTRIFKGDEAADKFMQERIYKPEQPLAYEYAGDVGDFLEKLETEYKIPPVLPEAVALQYLTAPATSQAARAAGKGALQAGMAVERGMEPVVRGALERGGLPREMVMAMGANTQSNVIKPKNGNWFGTSLEDSMSGLKRGVIDEEAARRLMGDDFVNQRMSDPIDNALNKWVDSNLTNYVKKQMATPEDPVRKLAEEGIVHIPSNEVGINRYRAPEHRERYGGEQLGQSEAARAWEDASDVAINAPKVGEIKSPGFIDRNPYVEKLSPDERIYGLNSPASYQQEIKGLGFDHILDVLREDLATGRIRPEQLNKVSMEQAVRRTYEYDQELAKKMAEARATSRAELPVYKDYPEGFKWIQLTRPGDFAAESDAMGHSVRGYEPPKGHPDYVEGSGDSGSSTYGLGGWEAIKSGEAKVYSLVDAKGEPHTTIEVGKGKHPIGFSGDGSNFPYGLTYGDSNNNYLEIPLEKQQEIYELGKKLYFENPNAYAENRILTGAQAPNLMDTFQKAADMLLGEKPGYVRQIKGKGNARPISKYDPYTQDFVKSGGWSDVRDLQNTGLINVDGRYFTEPELTEAAKKYGRMGVMDTTWDVARQRHIDAGISEEDALRNWVEGFKEGRGRLDIPPEGMKRGGKVSISNNPDTMMLEVNNQKMKNGVPAYAGAGLIKGGLKAAKPAISEAERALPLVLPRAMPKSKAEINAHAERVARQMMGEHVTSGKAGDTKNLAGRSLKESQRVKKLEYEFVPTKDVPESQPIQSQIGDINVALPGDFTVSDVELKSLMGEPINSRQEGGSRYGLGHLEDELPLFYASNEGPAQMVQDKVSDLYSLYEPERVMGQHMAMGPIATNFAQHFADANLKYTDYSKLRGADMDMFDQIMSQGYELTKKNKKTGEVKIKIVDFPDWPGIADPQAAYEAMKRNPEMRKFYNRIMQTPSITEPLGFPSGQDVRYAITSPDLRDMEVNLVGHGVGELVPNVDLTDTADHNTYLKGIRGIYKGHQDVLSPFAIAYPDATQHIISTQRPQDFTGTIQKVFPHQRVDQQFIDEMEQYRRRIKELTGKKKGGAVKKAAGGEITGDDLIIEERPL